MYVWKTTDLYNSLNIYKEQHRKLLPSNTFKCELMDETTIDCESNVADYDTIPNDSYAYGVVNINNCLNADEFIDIVNETLTKNERIKILKTKNSTQSTQFCSYRR